MPRAPSAETWVRVRTWLPLPAAVAALAFCLPEMLSFVHFMRDDIGASLAATLMWRAGHLHFGFPYGPLTLALQRLSLALPLPPAYAFVLLDALAIGGVANILARLMRALDLGIAAGLLLVAAAWLHGVSISYVPLYPFEALALMGALASWLRGRPRWALWWCVAGACVKASMAVVMGGFFALALLLGSRLGQRWRQLGRDLSGPLLGGAALVSGLCLWMGPRLCLRLLSPLAGARNHRLAGYGFFARGGNPFFFPGVHVLRYSLGTPLLLWSLALVALVILLLDPRARPAADTAVWWRWSGAFVCAAATLAFVLGFYGWRESFTEYLYLPLIGVAIFPVSTGVRWQRLLPGALLVLALLGSWNSLRSSVYYWRVERPRVATAGLFASSADAAAWQGFAAANPPSTHPLLLVSVGAPEAIFPAYGVPWHAYATAGTIQPEEAAALAERIAAADCIAWSGQSLILTPAEVTAIRARQPQQPVSTLAVAFGCTPWQAAPPVH